MLRAARASAWGNGMLKVLREPDEMHAAVDAWRGAGRTIGFVPTMGALHEGHFALIERARTECDITVVSIYVNPLQFGPSEDFARYPRPIEADLAACESLGVDLVLHPPEAVMNPPGYATFVNVERLSVPLEGERRPDHFRGVATIVTKLLNLARPHRAYFGQKDAQQAIIVGRLVADLNVGTEVVCCPTIRAADGLAKSSRNVYLDADQRRQAPALYRGLQEALARFEAGERRAGNLRDAARAPIEASAALRLDYVAAVDPADMTVWPDDAEVGNRALLAVAAYAGATRLIDNQMLPADAPLL